MKTDLWVIKASWLWIENDQPTGIILSGLYSNERDQVQLQCSYEARFLMTLVLFLLFSARRFLNVRSSKKKGTCLPKISIFTRLVSVRYKTERRARSLELKKRG